MITHSKVSGKSDSGDSSLIQPSDWNASHDEVVGVLTPAALSADVDDWEPSGLHTNRWLRVEPSGDDRWISGIDAGSAGEELIITNISATYDLYLPHENSSSAAANRFNLFGTSGSELQISHDRTVTLRYDDVSARWRIISHTASFNQPG
jgi:hypothetical protein